MRKAEPKTVAWEIVTADTPELVRVNVCRLFEPRGTVPKLTAVVFGARVPMVVLLLEPGFDGVPALVNPAQPETNEIARNSVAIMAKVASELCCLGSPVATSC